MPFGPLVFRTPRKNVKTKHKRAPASLFLLAFIRNVIPRTRVLYTQLEPVDFFLQLSVID